MDNSKARLRCTSPIVRETDILSALAEYLGQAFTEEMVLAHVCRVLIGKDGIRVIGIKEEVA